MKRMIFALLILVLPGALFFSGCVIKLNDEKTSLVIYDDGGAGSIPNEIVVEDGNKFVLKLEANMTTGYSWLVAIEDEELLSLLSSEYAADDEEAIGSGGVTTLTFSALGAGETTVTLTYAQDWEGGETDKEKTIVITIRGSLLSLKKL